MFLSCLKVVLEGMTTWNAAAALHKKSSTNKKGKITGKKTRQLYELFQYFKGH